MRDSAVYITSRTRWALARIVKASNGGDGDVGGVSSVDALADRILSQFIDAHHPRLMKLYALRERLDNKATKAAGGEPVPF